MAGQSTLLLHYFCTAFFIVIFSICIVFFLTKKAKFNSIKTFLSPPILFPKKMGNSLGTTNPKKLPIDNIFKLPSPIPSWPPGEGFASGTIDLGGLEVSQITSFTKIWSTYRGGPDNQGSSFFEPSSIPDGFFMLGSYCQSNNKPLFGWVLAGKDVAGEILAKPIDYTLVWKSEPSKRLNHNVPGYIWLPTPPEGYKPVGHVVTTSPEKPSVDKIRCVREDFTEECDVSKWIWGKGKEVDVDEFNVYGLRPRNVWVRGQGVGVGTFIGLNKGEDISKLSIFCLKNNNFYVNLFAMPKLPQVEAIIQAYSPILHFHPKETYLPASVNWYFANGVQLYHKGEESNPVSVELDGSNLPQEGSNDDEYWLDLPTDEKASEEVKKGNLKEAETYIHVKPTLGATFTDIQIWTFYPYNGPAFAKIGVVDYSMSRTGGHVGDWEHVTLRVSNFDGVLYSVYFAKHSGGVWMDSSLLEFIDGTNKFFAYASLHGHACYPCEGCEVQGTDVVGLRNDTAKSTDKFIDTGAKYSIVAGDYLEIVEPAWLKYARKWGPKKTYADIERLENTKLEGIVSHLPREVAGEDGPTGPKQKREWDGDER